MNMKKSVIGVLSLHENYFFRSHYAVGDPEGTEDRLGWILEGDYNIRNPRRQCQSDIFL